MPSVMTSRQAAELDIALGRTGWTARDVKRLSEGDLLAQVRDVVHGLAFIKRFVIDCDADPIIPNGWEVEEHRRGGQMEFDPSTITLFLSENQQNGKGVQGYDLREELSDMPVLNANVLDFLIDHPHLIPNSWKFNQRGGGAHRVLFWGTIFRDPRTGCLYVPFLFLLGGRTGVKGKDFYCLNYGLGHLESAAMLAS